LVSIVFIAHRLHHFISFHITQYLLDRGERVIGVDDLNAYYDLALKQARLA